MSRLIFDFNVRCFDDVFRIPLIVEELNLINFSWKSVSPESTQDRRMNSS